MSIYVIGRKIKYLRQELAQKMALPFRNALPAKTVRQMLDDENTQFRERVYSPWITLWAFLSQALDEDQCCRKAVSRVVAYSSMVGESPPSSDTGAYCRARKRLPENLLYRLLLWVAEKLQQKTTEEYLWCGRTVKIVDGSSVSMPDTPANQKEYPQPVQQAQGCGFSIARILVFFSLATGALVDVAVSARKIGELTLFTKIWKSLKSGDVILGDRGFCSYAHAVALLKRGVDIVLRLHQGRAVNFKRGKRLGEKDYLITWPRPKSPTKYVSKKELHTLPGMLILRQVEFAIDIPGFRAKKIVIITSLLDPAVYPIEQLALLYRARWDCELRLRDVKISMQMDILRGKTPDMIRKEIYTHLLAYNVIRNLMWDAAEIHGVQPLRLSVKGTLQHVSTFFPLIAHVSAKTRSRLYSLLLKTIASEVLPDRPNRIEPRLKKRRPKAYGWLQQPRDEAGRRLAG